MGDIAFFDEIEIEIDKNEFIVSETDAKGVIIDVNDYFLTVTGYDRDEVIGKHHNILRHSDMPKEAFRGMWSTIKSGRTWRGFVKNKAKNGAYYWVYATVSPINRIDGKSVYTSIRQAITLREKEKYTKLYAEMLEKERIERMGQ